MKKLVCAAVSCTLLVTGCVRIDARPHSRPAKPVPASVEDRYDYPRGGRVEPRITAFKEKWKYTVTQVKFDLYMPPDLIEEPVEKMRRDVAEKEKNNDKKGARDLELEYTVVIDYYQSKEPGRKPVIIVSPILGGNMVVDLFAAYFASKGFNAAIVHRRKPRYVSGKPLDQVEYNMRKSVIRTRQALDWLLTRPENDPEKAGSFGISYGGIINTLTASVEPRLKYHIIALAGGPVAELVLDTEEKAIQKYIRTAAEQEGYTVPKLREDLTKVLDSDTLAVAPYLEPESVFFVKAVFDHVVRPKYSKNLWVALGKPEILYVPLGHYSTMLTFPYLRWRAYKFYREKFYPERTIWKRLFSREDPPR